jgi:SAM-dependent methyltransferase
MMILGKPITLSDSRYEFAAKYLAARRSNLPLGDIYDVGAGDGRMRPGVEGLGLAWRGFDLEPRGAGIEKWDLDESCPHAGRNGAAVLLLDVLEHLPNPAIGLAHLAQVMAKGGLLVMTVPNPMWSRSRIHALLKGYPACFTQQDLDGNGHVFTPWPHIVGHLLDRAGFEVIQYATLDGATSWPAGPPSLRWPLRALHALACKAIERFDPRACGMSYAFVARLRE